MRDENISSVIIAENQDILGIVTQHDLVTKVIAAQKAAENITAEELMSKPVITVGSEADIEEAARLMRDRRIKKLLAVREGRIEGIITSFDLLVAEPVLRLLLERGL
jgi:CBS domain-containing protein